MKARVTVTTQKGKQLVALSQDGDWAASLLRVAVEDVYGLFWEYTDEDDENLSDEIVKLEAVVE